MNESFILKSSSDDCVIEFSGNIPEELRDYDEARYQINLISKSISAVVDVRDHRPIHWAKFFAEMAKERKGWKGVKECRSLEGEISMSATSDSLGHILIQVTLHPDLYARWELKYQIELDAGQLESIAHLAKKYFG